MMRDDMDPDSLRVQGEVLRRLSGPSELIREVVSALDERYLDRWSAELGLADLLARAREESARG